MEGAERGGGRRVAAAAPVRRSPRPAGGSGHRFRRTASFLWGAISVALLVAALLLGVVCLVLPKMLGAVPLTILSGSMVPAMPPGSLAVVRPVDVTQAQVGDVLSYQPEPDDPTLVTHRVVAVTRNAEGDVSLTLRGDANSAPDERPVRPEQVRGAVVYSVPYFGWVANRLNVGMGAKFSDWAAYALIAVGSLRILLGVPGSMTRRARSSGGRSVGLPPLEGGRYARPGVPVARSSRLWGDEAANPADSGSEGPPAP